MKATPDYAQVITTFYDPRYMDVRERRSIRHETSVSVLDMVNPEPKHVFIVDDHSPDPPYDTSVWESIIRAEDDDARGVGASLNRGMRAAWQDGFQYVLYAVDDWMARTRMEIDPVLRYMQTNTDILGVRLGLPHPDMTGTFRHTTDFGWYVDLDPHHYVVSHRPTLWRIEGIERLGWWPENCSALECEHEMNQRWIFSSGRMQMLYWLPTTFDHIEGVSLSGVNPLFR